MNRKAAWKRRVSVLIAFAFVAGSIAGLGNQKTEAAARKNIRFVKVMQGGKNVTQKRLKMKAGTTKKLTVKAKTTLSKKKIKFRSSNKKVVTVNENGTLKAKKAGSARITVTVSKKGFETKKTWVKVSVGKRDKTPAATQSPTPSVPTKSPDVPVNTLVPTGTPETIGVTAAPTTNQAVTESPDLPGTPDVTESPSATPDGGNDNGKILVAYFSWSGTSERIAQNIISQTGADSFRIERETPYSDDYNTVAYGEAKDEADNNARPPLKDPLDSVAAYDKIVLCYPIWWHTSPMTVGTFLESYDLTGKTIYPISQSASMDTSQYGESVAFIKECAEGATVDEGLFTKDNDAIWEYVENTVLQ